MKKNIIIIIALLSSISFGQSFSTIAPSFNSNYSFVENKGQFDRRGWQDGDDIKFGTKLGNVFIFFTNEGLTYRFESFKKVKVKGEHDNGTIRKNLSELINIEFLNANTNVEITTEGEQSFTNSYSIKNYATKEFHSITGAIGYKKITYVNIYDNIDIEYLFHPDGGIKYNVILNPGADPSNIKMRYTTKNKNTGEASEIELSTLGDLSIHTSLGKITEQKPITFYDGTNTIINSEYVYQNGVLEFQLDNYNSNQKVIIDPWTISPNFNAGDFTREVETDAAGNIYTIGGETPMVLRKYSTAGAMIWQYNTPWDTVGGDWLGTLATNAAGVSFITQGTGSEIERVNTGGGMDWHRTYSPGGLSTEFWSITFNCDDTKLIVGGTGQGGSLFDFEAVIYDINQSNGDVNGQTTVNTNNIGGFGSTPIEVRSITSSKNAKYIFQIHTDIGAINQNIGACPTDVPVYKTANTGLAYKCENFLSSDQNGGGLKSLTANDNFIYVNNGDEVRKYDVSTGALITTVTLPGGSANNGFGGRVVHCSGIDIDAVGNVYVGSMDRVVKFDQNLNVISSINTSGGFTVYDVSVSSNGEVIAGGALLNNGTASNRGSRIQSMNFATPGKYALVCCDVNICPAGPFCDTEVDQQLISTTAGGVWSGTGVDPATGIFSPSIAGVGNWTITYTLPCGSESMLIVVNNCSAPISVCEEANGDLTVNGGNGPYTWESINNTTTCTDPGSIFDNDCSTNCNFFGICDYFKNVTTTTYSTIGTGTTLSAPIPYPVRVTDNVGATITINSAGSVPVCVTSPLPVELISYNLSCNENEIVVNWSTASEINNDYFVIETASENGVFEKVIEIKGAGTSTSVNNYTTTLRSNGQLTYVRLYQIDFDGTQNSSVTRSIDCNSNALRVYPNPFDDEIIIEAGDLIKNSTGLVEIYNSVGQLIIRQEIQKNETNTRISSTELTSGLYIVRVKTDNETHTIRLIKK